MKVKSHSIFLIHIFFLCLIFFASSNPLSPDEAHYVQWSKNLDLAYYSKGPLLALLIFCSTAVFGSSEYAVRLPALFFTIMTFSFVYTLLRQTYDRKSSYIIYGTMLSSVALLYPALLMTTDAPVMFFWITSVYFLNSYLQKRNNFGHLLIGLCLLGFGIWTKYTIVVVPLIFALLLVYESKNKAKLIAELSVTSIVVIAFLSPIIYWNFQHGWVNISHNAAHAGSGVSRGINIKYFFDFIGSQLGVYGIFFFLVFQRSYVQLKEKKLDNALAILSSALLFAICLLVSLTKRIYPNWTIPAFLVLLMYQAPMLVELFYKRYKIYVLAVGLNLTVTILGVLLMLGVTFGVSGDILPTKKLVAWPEFSKNVRVLKSAYPDANLIITDSYDIAAELGYYAQEMRVYNASLGGRRMNQYDIWEQNRNTLSAIGDEKVLLLLGDVRNLNLFKDYFAEIEVVEPYPYYQYIFNGSKMRNLNAYICSGYNGKAFPTPTAR